MAAMIFFSRRLAPSLIALFVAVSASARAESYGGASDAPAALPSDWPAEQQRRTKALETYVKSKEVAYVWFKDFPFGKSSGAPFLVLQLMPRLAPELWGGADNFLSVAGMFVDSRNPGWPIAQGYGWTGLSREDPAGGVDYASITCGACHVGRVRLDDGSYRYLDGGVNNTFNLVQYRARVAKTFAKIVGDAASSEEQVKRATEAIIAALDKAHAENPNFFYHDFALGSRRFDAAYEAKQIELFKKNAPQIVAAYLIRANLELNSFLALVDKNYKGFEKQMVEGFGGMADATGVFTSLVYASAFAFGPPGAPLPELPPTQGLTDFMVVWEQGKRQTRWSEDHKRLIDGGGQWNGNIPLPVYRNLVAELTVGLGADTDIRVDALAEDLLRGLPAPVYPFPVDLALAKKGEALYRENCAACHHPHNGKAYDLGTDLGRARVVSENAAAGARFVLTAICSPATEITLPGSGEKVKPCAEYEGVSLQGKGDLAMSDPKDHVGYDALPLGGVWAQAPYLHNGSVPTLYHLLVPSERPSVFTKGRLDYDKKLVGYSWEMTSPTNKEEGYRLDTTAIPALSNRGHDKNWRDGDRTYKLDWSDDKDGAWAIIEYMKTF
jgi:RoxA-like, cytochrome c-like